MKYYLLLTIIGSLLLGGSIGYWLRRIIARSQKRSLEHDIAELMLNARSQATGIIEDAEQKAQKRMDDVQTYIRESESDNKKTKDHLEKREEKLDQRQSDLNRDFELLNEKIEEIRNLKEQRELLVLEQQALLISIAGLTPAEAREKIVEQASLEYGEDIAARMRKLELMGETNYKTRAREILMTCIQRLASPVTTENTVTSVPIDSDDVKGKIIGKEGRNIKAFERVTGVELIIDESPTEIIISSFDPIRRQVARVTLEALIKDGRIQPAKIEEFYEKAKSEIHEIVKTKGEEAVHELGIYNLDPRIIGILGRLHFRTSYGQNVLNHSIEVARLCEMLASEVGADPLIAKTAGLVHDIGKALDHEIEGTHVQIGMRILAKFGADERVITGMKSHHDEFPHESVESVIVQVCDQISGARPGARRDTLENYLKRLRELEAVVNSFAGVDKSYALQAGREIRVFVQPTVMSDLQAKHVARDMAMKIEKELRYPGEIKVTVIREQRIVEYAR